MEFRLQIRWAERQTDQNGYYNPTICSNSFRCWRNAERYKDLFYINLANNLGYFGPYEYICVLPIGRVVCWQVLLNRIQRDVKDVRPYPPIPMSKETSIRVTS